MNLDIKKEVKVKDIKIRNVSAKEQLFIKRKRFPFGFFMAVYLIGSCFIVRPCAGSIIKKIIKLERENQKLNEKIIAGLRFELSEERRFDKGETCKYLLKDKDTDDLWLFKIYKSSFPANATIATYRLSQLLGTDMSEITGTLLPVNERMKFGSIQRIIPKVKEINNIPFSKLSADQKECIMKNQVLDWLVFNKDVDEEEFLVKKDTGKIIAIDRDETFSVEKERISLDDNTGEDSYYYEFWKVYLKGGIDIDNINFKKVFEFIDYIQNIKDKYIVSIIKGLLKNSLDSVQLDSLIKAVILKKHNLRLDFEAFYGNLAETKGFFLQIPPVNKNNLYAQVVLKKLRKTVFEKKEKLSRLKHKEPRKQENIERISCSDAWYLIEKLNYAKREDFFSLSTETIKRLKDLEEKVFSVYEKFVICLYIEEIRNLQSKNGIENFVHQQIEQIILYSDRLTNSKILSIECRLRTVYMKSLKKFSEFRKIIDESPLNFIRHLDYFKYCLGFGETREEDLILKEYREWIKKNPEDLTYKVLYGILVRDLDYLEKIKDDIGLKYLGMALVWSFEYERDKIIKCCNKSVSLNKDNFVAYESYMLLGLIYEYNRQWKRFGEGFQVQKSIMAYKKAVIINPGSVKAQLKMGILYLLMEKPDKALGKFKIVNKLNPEYGKGHFHFNKIKEKKLYKDKGEYLDAIRMDTLNGRYHYIIGLAYLIKKDMKSAQKHFNKACEFGYEIDEREKRWLLNPATGE